MISSKVTAIVVLLSIVAILNLHHVSGVSGQNPMGIIKELPNDMADLTPRVVEPETGSVTVVFSGEKKTSTSTPRPTTTEKPKQNGVPSIGVPTIGLASGLVISLCLPIVLRRAGASA